MTNSPFTLMKTSLKYIVRMKQDLSRIQSRLIQAANERLSS